MSAQYHMIDVGQSELHELVEMDRRRVRETEQGVVSVHGLDTHGSCVHDACRCWSGKGATEVPTPLQLTTHTFMCKGAGGLVAVHDLQRA